MYTTQLFEYTTLNDIIVFVDCTREYQMLQLQARTITRKRYVNGYNKLLGHRQKIIWLLSHVSCSNITRQIFVVESTSWNADNWEKSFFFCIHRYRTLNRGYVCSIFIIILSSNLPSISFLYMLNSNSVD